MRYISLGLAAALLMSSTEFAQAQKAYFEGKTISVVVGSAAGGGNDAYTRLIARVLGAHIPGKPAVVPRNMPGASGITQMNFMFNIAPRDGTTIGATQLGTPFEPLFAAQSSQVKYDPLKFIWLGSPAQFASVAFAWHTSPVKKAEDLLQHELLVGSSGSSTNASTEAWLTNRVLGFKYKVVSGYSSGTDVDLAIERGEVHGRASSGWTGLKIRGADMIKEGKIILLYQIGLKKHPDIPAEVPLILDLAKTPEDRAVLELKFAPYSIGYPFFLPPETPAEGADQIKAAFTAALADAELRQAATAQRLDIDPVSGEEIEMILRGVFNSSPSVVSRVIAGIKPPTDAPGKGPR